MQTTITRPPELRDDDTPSTPECSPLDSAQARRASRLPVVITPAEPVALCALRSLKM
jgi:hypothetical protein